MSEDMKKYAGHRLPFISTIALDKKGRPNFDTKRAMASYEKAKGIRSSIIDEALMVESKLISVIIAFIFGEHRKSNRREMDLIMSFVFNAEFCTFMLKRKMLSKIFNICGNSIDCISKEDGKKLRRKLNEIILVRNKFAHGQILVDGFTYEPFIYYYDDVKKKEKIDDESEVQHIEKCKEVERGLSTLAEYFRHHKIE